MKPQPSLEQRETALSRALLQVTFRDIEPTDAIESAIREKVAKLGRFGPLERCRVMVELPHKHRRRGAPYHVRIDMSVPGADLVVADHGHRKASHQDIHVAIRDAFRAARRELQSYADKRCGHVKRHTV